MPVHFRFCLNINCIDKAMRVIEKEGAQVDFPPFDGHIGVPPDIKVTLKEELPKLERFNWVDMPENPPVVQTLT